MLEGLRTKRRYVAYTCLLFNAYIECCSRFGISIAMLGGMVKVDCDDTEDIGTFCWSDNTQALVLGAYFYGHIAQCLTTYIAKRFTGFTMTYRFWLVASAIIQLCFPTFSGISPALVISTQILRGFLAGIMPAYHFDYVAKYSVGKENKALISIFGANDYIGQGTGGLIAGFVTKMLGWEYYFYLTGAAYLLGFLLNLAFVSDSPEQSWYLTKEEKDLMLKRHHEVKIVISDVNDQKVDFPLVKPDNTPTESNEDLKHGTDSQSAPSLKSLICRLYLLAFCIYIPAYNLIYFNLLNVVPFYLRKVLDAEPIFISSLNVGLSVLIAICTLLFSYIFQKLDKVISWLKCRMIFALLPMFLQTIALVSLTFATTVTESVVILTGSAIASATLFSGSVYTINYEIDPDNSAFLVSIFNSCGQISGFIGPIMMAAITTTDPNTPDYDSIYRQKWAYFFYAVAGFAASGILAILGAYLVRPGEWVNRDREKRS